MHEVADVTSDIRHGQVEGEELVIDCVISEALGGVDVDHPSFLDGAAGRIDREEAIIVSLHGE